jgi:hypothetical protein
MLSGSDGHQITNTIAGGVILMDNDYQEYEKECAVIREINKLH